MQRPTLADAKAHPNTQRSRFWISELHDALHAQYPGIDIRVFSKYNTDNKEEFGLNELLYDVMVCETATVPSSSHGKPLRYIKRVLWQVESEFQNDSGHTLRDFNKLVLGSAERKPFIGGSVSDNEAFINVLAPAAAACTGDVFVALAPHPRAWGTPSISELRLWRYDSGWMPVPLEQL
jgi:hypothetical protein